ncbi:MAG: DUF1634 domain-containing protein [Acidimicrobiales bacterium]|jgi:uncharacterized membrane protein
MARAVSNVLRAGILISSLVIAAGIALTFASPASRASARRAVPQLRRGVIHPAGLHTPHTIAAVISGVGRGDGPALVMLGLLLLIATPVLRVAVSVIGFALDRDRLFVLITLAVLAVLIGSFAIGT